MLVGDHGAEDDVGESAIEQGIRSIRLVEISSRDRLGQLPIVGLARDLQDPARHRDGDTVVGQLARQPAENPSHWFYR